MPGYFVLFTYNAIFVHKAKMVNNPLFIQFKKRLFIELRVKAFLMRVNFI